MGAHFFLSVGILVLFVYLFLDVRWEKDFHEERWDELWAWFEVVGWRHIFVLLWAAWVVYLVLTFKNCTVQLTFFITRNLRIFKSLSLFSLQMIEDCATKRCRCLLSSSKRVFFCLLRCLLGFTNNDDDDGRTLKTMVATHTISPLANIFNISKSITWLASNDDGNTIIFKTFCVFLGCVLPSWIVAVFFW